MKSNTCEIDHKLWCLIGAFMLEHIINRLLTEMFMMWYQSRFAKDYGQYCAMVCP
jgi:hypothetical protein